MQSVALEDVVRQDPFRPFDIHTDGRVISVSHPEQVFITPSKTTAVIAHENEHLSIVDLDHISSITLKNAHPRRRKSV